MDRPDNVIILNRKQFEELPQGLVNEIMNCGPYGYDLLYATLMLADDEGTSYLQAIERVLWDLENG